MEDPIIVRCQCAAAWFNVQHQAQEQVAVLNDGTPAHHWTWKAMPEVKVQVYAFDIEADSGGAFSCGDLEMLHRSK